MSLGEAFVPIEAYYHARVQAETWGHLAPRKNKIYRGRLVYAVGCFGHDHLNPTVLTSEFGDLENSPWFFDAMTDFLLDQETEPGCVYEFRGTFRNYTFNGTITCLMNVNTPQY